MTRYMYDAIWANAGSLAIAPGLSLYGLYLTGSDAIRWKSVPGFLAKAVPVRIDQGGQGSPQYEADVFDVEPGAWTMAAALEAVKKSTAPRPVIYCDLNEYAAIPGYYQGGIWLAAPGRTDIQAAELAAPDKRIVAVQNVWAKVYDRSLVVDPYWPMLPAKPVASPTGIVFSVFPVQMQLNVKCDPVTGPAAAYEWQLEKLGIHGWALVQQDSSTGPVMTFRYVEPKSNYRFRVTRGTWSDWVNVAT